MNPFKTFLRCFCPGALLLLGTADAGTISYTYDPAGRLVAADYGGGKAASYAYDNAGNLLQSSIPSPGLMAVSLNGNQLTLAWPATPGAFVLQSTSAITAGAAWNNVGVTPKQIGNRYWVTLTLSGDTTFYRLQR